MHIFVISDIYSYIKYLLQDNKVEPEQFTERLQKELKSSPQPYLVPFLKVTIAFIGVTYIYTF